MTPQRWSGGFCKLDFNFLQANKLHSNGKNREENQECDRLAKDAAFEDVEFLIWNDGALAQLQLAMTEGRESALYANFDGSFQKTIMKDPRAPTIVRPGIGFTIYVALRLSRETVWLAEGCQKVHAEDSDHCERLALRRTLLALCDVASGLKEMFR